MLEESLVFAMDNEDPFAKMLFYARTAPLLRRWADESPEYRLRLPASFPYEGDPGDLRKLADYFAEYAQAAAEQSTTSVMAIVMSLRCSDRNGYNSVTDDL